MLSRLIIVYSGARAPARFVPIVLVLCLFGCGSSASPNSVSPPPSRAATPTFSPGAGSYIGTQTVTITSSTSSAILCWNTTGSPATNGLGTGCATGISLTNGGSITVSVGETVYAVAGTSSLSDSTVGAAAYVIQNSEPPVGIQPSSFGMQCGTGDTRDCKGSGSTPIVWPDTHAQPGLLRLHDAGTYWAQLNPSNGTYDWSNLDNWLDVIAQHQPRAVIQVFTWVPCWDSTVGTCGIDPTAPTGTNGIPSDLTASGSPTFNAFITGFVQHCSPNNNCVANLIKYYEMWNEWNQTFHWTGTMAQLYQMVASAVPIIRASVPSAVILTPSTSAYSETGLGYQTDFQNWLNYENANGRVSDWIAWHVYLSTSDTTTAIPEVQWSNYNANFLSIQNSTPSWATTPWANTETNFNGSTELEYTCPSAYTADDCAGQIVRWQLLHASNGASSLDWYKWNQTIGLVPQYETAYYWMMQYTLGGKFTATASSTGSAGSEIWSAPFVETNGTVALFVWTPSESGATFTVPAGYTDYRDLAGATTTVTSGQQINIRTEPILLEQ